MHILLASHNSECRFDQVEALKKILSGMKNNYSLYFDRQNFELEHYLKGIKTPKKFEGRKKSILYNRLSLAIFLTRSSRLEADYIHLLYKKLSNKGVNSIIINSKGQLI